MLSSLLLGAALALGQQGLPVPEAPAPRAAPPATAPDRWLLMKELQGTWEGSVLDSERMQVTGWIEASTNASSAVHSNGPLGFDYRANEFLLQQNWVPRRAACSAAS
jgi:hypothetical protein